MIEGYDPQGRFIVKLNLAYKSAESRVGLPIRVSLAVVGEGLVRSFAGDPALRGKLEDALAEYAQRCTGALAATIYRPTSYKYVLYLPPGAVDAHPIPIQPPLRNHLEINVQGDADWDEFCSYLYAERQRTGLFAAFRNLFRKAKRRSFDAPKG